MQRWLPGIAVVVGTVGVGLGSFIYTQLTHLEWENVSGDVYVIQGLGGNVGVLKTSEGAVVVDTMTFPLQGERIRALAEAGLSLEQAQSTIDLEIDEGCGPAGLPPIVVLDFDGAVASIWDGISATE